MNLHLLAVPYDSGRRGWRMGAGPDRLLADGAADRLHVAGHVVEVEHVDLSDPPPPEIRAAFDIAARLSERVATIHAAGALPVILAGNCATAMGTLAGLADTNPAIVWLDAHADFNTPETTRSGMFDGMALAIATGRCWTALAAAIPGFRPIPDTRVCLAGARDVDGAEAALLAASAATVLPPSALAEQLSPTLDALRGQTRTVYLHIDLDVLDPAEGTVNAFSAPGGLRLAQVTGLIAEVRARFHLGAVALTAYDPAYDADGRVSAAALAILDAIAT
jgi:arginase